MTHRIAIITTRRMIDCAPDGSGATESDWFSLSAEFAGATNGVLAVGASARVAGLALMGRWCLDRGAMAAEVDGVAVADLKAAVERWEAERMRGPIG
jgi:hypothetical protein